MLNSNYVCFHVYNECTLHTAYVRYVLYANQMHWFVTLFLLVICANLRTSRHTHTTRMSVRMWWIDRPACMLSSTVSQCTVWCAAARCIVDSLILCFFFLQSNVAKSGVKLAVCNRCLYTVYIAYITLCYGLVWATNAHIVGNCWFISTYKCVVYSMLFLFLSICPMSVPNTHTF